MTTKFTAYDLPSLFNEFALMPKFTDDIEYLASLAEKEEWDYKNTQNTNSKPILRNYLKYTYKRIAEEKKVAITSDEEYACWNLGLITNNQEPIYILFEKNRLPAHQSYWHFWKFCRRGEWELNKFGSLPEMAHYFDDPSVLVYDTRRELRANIEHIVADNLSRFPAYLQGMNSYGLVNMVKGAIDSAIERVKRNYKTAVPQYYDGTIQLLLPLSLTDPSKPELAIAVERFSDFYRAATCLTLDMAYNNARQLARPDRDWLAP
ncbi:MAG: DUF3825 domain-containing protein [Acidobacteria bacterium]|nr:DUF3825 domain-containing protein [Acidobacteriota bacterium]